MKTLIVGSGDEFSFELMKKYFLWADFVIAADGGLVHLKNAHLNPNVLIGDFDSLPEDILEQERLKNEVEIVPFPKKKDYTDLELAIDYAIDKGVSQLVILGAVGSRMDHTIANVHLLYKLINSNVFGYIEDDHNRVYMVDKKLILQREQGYNVSIIPMPPFAKGVSTEGLMYKLDEANLSFGNSIGVSNEFAEEQAIISLREGILLVFVSRD